MKIVIDIPEEVKQAFDRFKIDDLKSGFYDHGGIIGKAIKKGTPLPKSHGRLIDADAFIAFIKDVSKRHKYENLRVDGIITVDDVLTAVIESLQNEGLAEGNTPTIIEAESEE